MAKSYNVFMAIVITLILLVVLFYALGKHIGPAHLAVIAGISINAAFNEIIVSVVRKLVDLPADVLGQCVYVLLVFVLPLVLYLHSSKGGLFGILRIVESVVFAAFLVSLMSGPLSFFFQFDSLSAQIFGVIEKFKNPILLVGIISAYVDVIFYRD